MEEWENLISYLDKFVRPELELAFKRGTRNYGAAYKDKKVKERRPDKDIRHVRELHVDVRLREAEEAIDNENIQAALEKIESAIGYLVILHMRTRERRNYFEPVSPAEKRPNANK